MNCDECKERVLELIEREAVDPEGVREVLERCPECRALFEQMQSALRAAAALPVEEPPAEIDAAIMRAARGRSQKVVPLRRRWFQSPQWAVAAAALLAIGVGVWSIPRGEEVVMEDASGPAPELEEAMPAETMDAPVVDEQAARKRLPAEVASNEAGDLATPTPDPRTAAAKKPSAPRPRRSKRAERKVAQDADAPVAAERGAAAPAKTESRQAFAAGASADMEAAEEDAPSAVATKKERRALSPACQKRLAKLEQRADDQKGGKTDPEEALAIGRCYQAVGDVPEARRWFERAASDPSTKERATRALRELADE